MEFAPAVLAKLLPHHFPALRRGQRQSSKFLDWPAGRATMSTLPDRSWLLEFWT
jgi:hypothetical protein